MDPEAQAAINEWAGLPPDAPVTVETDQQVFANDDGSFELNLLADPRRHLITTGAGRFEVLLPESALLYSHRRYQARLVKELTKHPPPEVRA